VPLWPDVGPSLAARITLATKNFINTQKGKTRCCELY
jgi:hypothetical protein